MSGSADAPVVVGVGASAEGLAAVRLAAVEAASWHRPLHILHAFNWAAAPSHPSPAGPRADAQELIARAIAVATEVDADLTVDDELVEGPAVTTLIRRSETAELVALGEGDLSRHHGVPQETPAVQVAARAGCPVLVARATPPPSGPILVGVDGSASARTALAVALDYAARRAAELLVVRVHETDAADGARAGAAADPMAGLPAPPVPVEFLDLHGEPGPVLVEQSRSAALVVVAARGDAPLRGMLGEVPQSLLYHSPAPVLVVRGVSGVSRQP